MHKQTILDNGLKVITNRFQDAHSLSVGLWIKTGGRYENSKNQGVSHFMEHMLFKGTKKRSCQQIKQNIEEKGGAFNAFTSEEYVCYYVKILSEHIDLATEVLSDMVLNSVFDKREVEKERKVICEEIRMYLDLPMQHVHDLLDELLWPNHPLGMPLVGTYKTVGAITQKHLLERKELFHAPNNIIAVASGNIEHDKFVKTLGKISKNQKPRKSQTFEKLKQVDSTRRANFFYKATEQSHLSLGVRALSRDHKQRYSLALLNIILGGNMSSRLFNEIREKRSLAYEIGSATKYYSDTGAFLIHAGVDNKKVKNAVTVMVKELKKLKSKPVAKRELNMAKEYYRSALLMALEGTMSSMLFLGEQAASISKIATKEKILREVDKVNENSIMDVANMVLKSNSLRLALIGPQKDKEKKDIESLLSL